MGPFASLPRSLALARLKSNIFLLFLLLVISRLFTPYTALRRGLEQVGNEYWHSGYIRKILWGLETSLGCVMIWNILESTTNLLYPPPPISTPSTLNLTPAKMSSPLTRPSSSPSSSPFNKEIPLRNSLINLPQSTSRQSLSTPTQTRQGRASPLSSSTAKALNLTPEAPSSTGLFFDDDNSASPAKLNGTPVSQAGLASQTQGGLSTGKIGGEFVMVDREDKDWVENVRRGLRGKGVRL
ncbi:hypothetical protein M231_00615 [Tremella mesenterica]|uniref:Uncharacterized protein n=1 Tax=Tremella mesenterica TaxID=5217 RepID=A0A4Q1BW28_TREME|nr:hypothetical protein M231_00615 [Tremella mesenterica]